MERLICELGYVFDKVRFGNGFKYIIFNCIGDIKATFTLEDDIVYQISIMDMSLQDSKKLLKVLESYEKL